MLGDEFLNSTVNLTVKGAEISASLIKALIKAFVAHQDNRHGEQSMASLNRKNQTLENFNIKSADLEKVRKDLKKLGVDFAIYENKSAGSYEVFFKGKDTSQIYVALKDYVSTVLEKEEEVVEKEPIKDQVKNAKEKADRQNAERKENEKDKTKTASREESL